MVWSGAEPGIYSDWESCKQQIQGFAGAKYKGFPSIEAAKAAFAAGYEATKQHEHLTQVSERFKPDELSICVDAACSGNPGRMEYRGVWAANGDPIFHAGPFEKANNNVGEFLAIVHALAWMKQNNIRSTVYSDSRTAIAWVRNKKIKSELVPVEANRKVFELLARAQAWLQLNPDHATVEKWETRLLGEIPADFGRK